MAVSLNKINEEADKRFTSFVVEDVPGGDVTLRNAIRLTKAERAQLVEMQSRITALKSAESFDESELLSLLADLLDLLAVGDAGKRLFGELDDDLPKLLVLIEMYAEDTQLGEALRSVS